MKRKYRIKRTWNGYEAQVKYGWLPLWFTISIYSQYQMAERGCDLHNTEHTVIDYEPRQLKEK